MLDLRRPLKGIMEGRSEKDQAPFKKSCAICFLSPASSRKVRIKRKSAPWSAPRRGLPSQSAKFAHTMEGIADSVMLVSEPFASLTVWKRCCTSCHRPRAGTADFCVMQAVTCRRRSENLAQRRRLD